MFWLGLFIMLLPLIAMSVYMISQDWRAWLFATLTVFGLLLCIVVGMLLIQHSKPGFLNGENAKSMGYKELDVEELKADLDRLSEVNKSSDSTRQGAFLKLDPGTHKLRVLPPNDSSKSNVPYVVRWYHGPHKYEGKTRFYTCGSKHQMPSGCPLCKVGQKPRETYLLNVVNRKDSETYVLQMTRAKLTTLMMQLKEMPEALNVDNGYDITYIATGTGIDRRYQGPMVMAKASPVGTHKPAYNLERIVDQGYNFEEMQSVADFIKGTTEKA